MTTEETARPQTEVSPGESVQTGGLRPYRVILHNDEVNDQEYVVTTICRLTPLKAAEAVEKMLEAHTKGLSVLLVCHRERAELYEEQFRSCRLTVTIEPE